MLRGRFAARSGRPYVGAQLTLPYLGISARIPFCVDTGADATILMPNDALAIGVRYGRLSGKSQNLGIGGICRSFTEPGQIIHLYRVDLLIADCESDIMAMPSLLGRDILNRWRMVYDPPKSRLTFQVFSADLSVPVRL